MLNDRRGESCQHNEGERASSSTLSQRHRVHMFAHPSRPGQVRPGDVALAAPAPVRAYLPGYRWHDGTGPGLFMILGCVLACRSRKCPFCRDAGPAEAPALAQIPDPHRHGIPLLLRTDGPGCTKAFLPHTSGALRERDVAAEFSVGWPVGHRERAAINGKPGERPGRRTRLPAPSAPTKNRTTQLRSPVNSGG